MATVLSNTSLVSIVTAARTLCLSVIHDSFGLDRSVVISVKAIRCRRMEPSTGGHGYDLSFEVQEAKGPRIDTVGANVVQSFATGTYETQFSFGIIPQSFDRFIRLSRNFTDYSELAMPHDQGEVLSTSDNGYTYRAGELDRLINGKRTDHIPAIRLLAIAISGPFATAEKDLVSASIEFFKYSDPRKTLSVERSGTVGVMKQDAETVARFELTQG
ncbi:hypothetical protein ACFSVK_24605 [Azorhizophilus paspali]